METPTMFSMKKGDTHLKITFGIDEGGDIYPLPQEESKYTLVLLRDDEVQVIETQDPFTEVESFMLSLTDPHVFQGYNFEVYKDYHTCYLRVPRGYPSAILIATKINEIAFEGNDLIYRVDSETSYLQDRERALSLSAWEKLGNKLVA